MKYLKSLKLKFINLRALMGLHEKFPTFGNLVQRDEQMRKNTISVTGIPDQEPDINPKETRA